MLILIEIQEEKINKVLAIAQDADKITVLNQDQEDK